MHTVLAISIYRTCGGIRQHAYRIGYINSQLLHVSREIVLLDAIILIIRGILCSSSSKFKLSMTAVAAVRSSGT